MTTIKQKIGFLILVALFLFVGCSDDSNNNNSNPVTPGAEEKSTLVGAWKLSYYDSDSLAVTDTLNVTAMINGLDGVVGGTSEIFITQGTRRGRASGSVTGTFSDSLLNIEGSTLLGEFKFFGVRNGLDYYGSFDCIIYSSPFNFPDTINLPTAHFKQITQNGA